MSALSKLKQAFQGAAQRIIEPRNLLADCVAIGATVCLSLAFGSAVLPPLALTAAVLIVFDTVEGASLALKKGASAPAP
jgi:hypothetical protein